MLTDAPGFISVWTGNFPNPKLLSQYCEATYDEHGNGSCGLWLQLNVAFFDHDFQEAHHFPALVSDWVEALTGFSYAESYANLVISDIHEHGRSTDNSILFLFNCKFTPDTKRSHPLRYLGTYPYVMV